MNEKRLIKELGFKRSLKIRDYFMGHISEDDRTSLEDIGGYCEVKKGDVVVIIVMRHPNKKR